MEASRAQYGDLPWYLSPLDGAEEDNYCLEAEGENRPERQTVETGGEEEGEEEAAPSCHHGQCSSEHARVEAPEYLQRGFLGPRVIPRPRPPSSACCLSCFLAPWGAGLAVSSGDLSTSLVRNRPVYWSGFALCLLDALVADMWL